MDTSDTEPHAHVRFSTITFALQTVGCKLNRAESESLARTFLDAGFAMVDTDESPDIYVLNTCTVTHIADRKCRQYLRSFRQRNPHSLIVAMGCYVERSTPEVDRIESVDLVIGNRDKDRALERIAAHLRTGNGHWAQRRSSFPIEGEEILSLPDGERIGVRGIKPTAFRTRAMIKVQDGCSHGCSYCIVPRVRGRETSIPPEQVLAEIKSRVDEGCKEIVLTGTRIGAYGYHGGIEGLIECILDQSAIARIRLSSLQPREISSTLIDLWEKDERICRHLHLALQSGSKSVLQRMRRDYSLTEYAQAVNDVREAMPDIAITTDIIVGFPGETDEEFDESYRFCQRIGFANLHVFPYSVRTGTPAARMSGRVPDKIKKARSRRMLDLARTSSHEFRRRFRGETMPVLWEENKGNMWIGHTGNYIKVFARTDEPLGNRVTPAKLGDECKQGLWGEVLGLETPVAQRG
ncbi:MAG: tRNA (N(6)-L-threonylcarbamoyladenosine(37)-C(2))-methylthiotransferase MtaB [Chloroflexi bacterium]|nr:tRNA (N(6)-L-threonylcarbamoyladenosine(37)-C(2))-methylthiotransferase MtaB [Chloroflexota bacterium]